MKRTNGLNLRQVSTNKELADIIANLRAEGHSIGFVPTMGALHQGHISLIDRARKESDFVVCSIFVNPTQFNDPSDLEKYPRTLDSDIKLLKDANCDLVYTPNVDEVYQNASDFDFDFAGLDLPMEGANRPGHFTGVVQVVKRLFELVNPDKAFFGLKDFQQYAIIKQLVRYFELPIEIVGCPIIREETGLAMSSRNVRIRPEKMEAALSLSRALKLIQLEWSKGSVSDAIESAKAVLHPDVQLEYLEVAEPTYLKTLSDWDVNDSARAFIAASVGDVRLIDNMEIY